MEDRYLESELEELSSPVLIQLSNTLLESAKSEVEFVYRVTPASKAFLVGACWALVSCLLLVACCGLPEHFLKDRGTEPAKGRMPPSMLYALLVTMFLEHYSTDNYQTSMPLMADEFGVSQVDMSLSVLVHLFSFAVFIHILGPLSDRVGRRPVILGSQVLLAASTMGCGCADSFAWFMTGRACQGAAASVYCVILAAVRDCYSDEAERTSITGIVFATGTFGPLIAPVLGGLTASLFGWRYSFFNISLGTLLLSAFSFFTVKETAPPYEEAGDNYVGSVLRVLACKRRLLIIVCLGGFKSFFDIIASSSGFILIWQYHFSNTVASMLSSLIAVAGILGIMLSHGLAGVETDVLCAYSPFILLAAIAVLLAGLLGGTSVAGYLASICFAQVMLYPPIMALMDDFLTDLQDIAGLAASVQTSGAQLISTFMALPGVVSATRGGSRMLEALAISMTATQVMLWIGLVPMGLWRCELKQAT